MNRQLLLIFLLGLLWTARVDGNGRGHSSAGRGASFGHAGGAGARGVGGHAIHGQGAFGFDVGRHGFGIKRSWPLYGGFGIYGSQYYAPLQSPESDASPVEDFDSPPAYYYQKPPESNIKPNCQDAPWAGKGSSSSLSSFMNKVFELQCQNRHPEAESKPAVPAPQSRK